MEVFSIEKELKNKIDAIWEDERFKNINFLIRGYAVQDEIISNSILFIGINPSFTGENVYDVSHFYNNQQIGEVYSYFKKFQDISKKTNQTWAHLDLLYIRATNQKEVEKIISNEFGKEFIQSQLELSKHIIEISKPKIIVVCNTLARDMLHTCFKFEFDNELGTHKILENELLRNVPIFFTSMLTGQRALDLVSYERLIWHINKVLT